MITFPNAKLNLGLNITAKRADGYHDIRSCFVPIGWRDALEAVHADQFEFTSSGLTILGETDQNLCVKAYEMLKVEFGIPPVKMHLHKAIPMGAGLGGGSADGAFCLKLLNELFELNLSVKRLEEYAQSLGADCPFFIENTPRLVSGIGERFEPVELNLEGLFLVVVFPNVHVSTGKAFSMMTPQIPANPIESIILKNIAEWQSELINDFEKPFFEMHPELGNIKTQLIENGAIYASMSGSGSSVYGIFDKEPIVNSFKTHAAYQVWSGTFGL